MPFLSVLGANELSIVERYLKPVQFTKDSRIIEEGGPGDSCYIIDEGEVRLELQKLRETDSDGVLGYLGPGMFLGEFALLDGRPRSATAYAHTDVAARWFSTSDFEELCEKHPTIGMTMLKALGQAVSIKLRQQNDRIAENILVDESDAETDEMVARAVTAQKAFEEWPEERIDALLRDVAEVIAGRAEELAEACVVESGIGVAADKV